MNYPVEAITETGCHIFMGPTSRGYGRVYITGMGHVGAHRVAFGMDKIPKGKMVLHKCDVRCCVNPDHLFLGTNTDNMRDMVAKGRGGSQNKKSCPRGHPYDHTHENGYRACKTCMRDRTREFRARQKLTKRC